MQVRRGKRKSEKRKNQDALNLQLTDEIEDIKYLIKKTKVSVVVSSEFDKIQRSSIKPASEIFEHSEDVVEESRKHQNRSNLIEVLTLPCNTSMTTFWQRTHRLPSCHHHIFCPSSPVKPSLQPISPVKNPQHEDDVDAQSTDFMERVNLLLKQARSEASQDTITTSAAEVQHENQSSKL